jgi:hypothetical protein
MSEATDDLRSVAAELLPCAKAHDRDSRLLGNVRAEDIARLCHGFLAISGEDVTDALMVAADNFRYGNVLDDIARVFKDTPAGPGLTVDEIIDRAVKTKADLAAARAEIERLRAGVAEAMANCDLCDGTGMTSQGAVLDLNAKQITNPLGPCPRCGPLRAMVEGGGQ